MPYYEYKCNKCGTAFTLAQSLAEHAAAARQMPWLRQQGRDADPQSGVRQHGQEIVTTPVVQDTPVLAERVT